MLMHLALLLAPGKQHYGQWSFHGHMSLKYDYNIHANVHEYYSEITKTLLKIANSNQLFLLFLLFNILYDFVYTKLYV